MIVCSIVGILGIISAILGFLAEATRIKASDVQPRASGRCHYPKSPALSFGLGAAVSLMVAQAIINTVAGCLCCRRNSPPSTSVNWSLALISYTVSWIAFIIAFLLLLTGAALNDQKSEESMYFGDYCYVVKPGVFSAGAVLSLASVALGIFYYFTLSLLKRGVDSQQNGRGITMGQPVIPAQSEQPVFVHEDTYNRQQMP